MPGGVLVNWGILSSDSSLDWVTVTFPSYKSYTYAPAVFVTWEHSSEHTEWNYVYVKSSSVTKTSFQTKRSDKGKAYWMAIGKA